MSRASNLEARRPGPTITCRVAVLAGLIVCTTALAGCREDFLDRRDTVTLGVGEANAHNKAVQTRDPWPPVASARNSTTRGDQVQKVQEEFIKRDRYDQSRGNGRSAIKEQ
jgi:hypothetical protein